MNRQKIACNCKNIIYGMIEDAIKAGAKNYEDVEKQLRCGTEETTGWTAQIIQHEIDHCDGIVI